ncbi:MFS transporter [Rodentibacter myodis]|uniref:MFS transporter n=1 Tax=Rodentibacter myodis TaxID=1907939 RepID=UPI001ABFDD41|nr:MFS transporter [Rodentibacter myodis]
MKKIKQSLNYFFPHISFEENNIKALIDIKYSSLKQKHIPITQLFTKQHRFFTISIWCVSLCNMIGFYFLSNWLPTLAKVSGYDLQQAVLLGATLQIGGALGTFIMGRMIDKQDFFYVMVPCFVIAIISIVGISQLSSQQGILFLLTFIAGFAVVGGQPAINAMAANFYPVNLRTTGVGWSLGIGRIGSVIGPLLGGYLLLINLSISSIFFIIALLSTLIVALLVWLYISINKKI